MEGEASQYGVVLVTASSRAEAEAIAKVLLEEKRVACANLFPVQSVYAWQGQLCQEEEWQLFLKTDLSKFSTLEQRIRQLHSYEVPEILAIPFVQGSLPYLQWLSGNMG